jgi:4-oxalocrotonate tautomerase
MDNGLTQPQAGEVIAHLACRLAQCLFGDAGCQGGLRKTRSSGPIEEKSMPHVIVKLWPGKSEQQKQKLAAEITKAVMAMLHYGEESVSVAMEEVKAVDWSEKVYRPDIPPSATRSTKSRGTNRDLRHRPVHREAASFAERWRSALTTSTKAAED